MRCGAALAYSVAEDHVDLVGFIQPHGDLGGEQVSEVDDLLAGVLELPDYTHPWRPALGHDGLQRCIGALAQGVVGLVGDHVGQLVHDQEHERLP
ncbi:MAG: hypothetical protein ACRDRQ_11575 [Pseudonocardiaceae bacterium]